MKTLKIGLIRCLYPLLLSPVWTFAQTAQRDTGIAFETSLSWPQIEAKAKAENKMIFMDCYATWCGPCKFMEQHIYPLKNVGDYFNQHFINVKVQMDKTKADDQQVKDWYADADSIAKTYHVNAYPTYLFFLPGGQALHEVAGSSENGAQFITAATATESPNKQYFTLLAMQEAHKDDSVFLLNATLASQVAGDNEHARLFANNYIASLHQPITKPSLNIAGDYVISESDKGFQIFLRNAAKIDELYGQPDKAEKHLEKVVFDEEIKPLFNNNGAPILLKPIITNTVAKYPTINKEKFSGMLQALVNGVIGDEIYKTLKEKQIRIKDTIEISKALRRRFPDHDCGQIFLYWLSRYYMDIKSWDDCAKSTITLFNRYSDRLSNYTLNQFAWDGIFVNCTDQKILRKAATYMKRVVDETPGSAPNAATFRDTYANILYKAGYREQAIEWEQTAIKVDRATGSDGVAFVKTLERMQKNQSTWGKDADL